jgi:hypothetical protein
MQYVSNHMQGPRGRVTLEAGAQRHAHPMEKEPRTIHRLACGLESVFPCTGPVPYFVRWVIKVNWWRHVQGVRHNPALRISLNILYASYLHQSQLDIVLSYYIQAL